MEKEEEETSSPFYSNDTIQNFLEKEIVNVKKETWSRLDKTTKLTKLRQYFEKGTEVGTWTKEEADATYEYLRSCFDRKRPHPNRVIKYDILTGIVISIKSSAPGTKTAKATKTSFASSAPTNASVSVSARDEHASSHASHASHASSHDTLSAEGTIHVDIDEVLTKKKKTGGGACSKKTLKQSRSVLSAGGEHASE